MKALIIGAAGFVGDYLVDAIKENLLCDVYVTKLPYEKIDRKDVEVVDLDVLNQMAIYNLLIKEKPFYIFYLAAQSSIAYSWRNPTLTVEVNVKGSLNLLNSVRNLAYSPKLLLVGSGEEYGAIDTNQIPIAEETLLKPGNIYAATKACQNMMGTIYSKAFGVRAIMVRAFNHMGPKQSDNFVVSDFCKQVIMIEKKLKEPVLYVGNLNAKRDFTDVRDVVQAYTDLIQFGDVGETYNVGSGHAVSINDILMLILKNTKAKIEIEINSEKLRPIDIPVIEADITRLQKTTGWSPKFSLEQTIQDTLEYWRKTIKERVEA